MPPTHPRYDYLYRGNPQEFMGRVSRIPNLEQDEELSLINAWQTEGNKQALNILIAAHQKFLVRNIATRRLFDRFDEALQAGNIALVKAVNGFKPEALVRLATYAQWWVRAELDGITYRNSMVNVETTVARKTVMRNLNRALKSIRGDNLPPTYTDLVKAAQALRVDVKDVLEVFPMMNGDVSLDAPMQYGEDSGSRMDYLVDVQPDPEEVMLQLDEVEKARLRLKQAMETLKERPRYIFQARRLNDPPVTLEELAKMFNVSRERIRQIEVKAFENVLAKVREQSSVKNDNDQRQPAPTSEPLTHDI